MLAPEIGGYITASQIATVLRAEHPHQRPENLVERGRHEHTRIQRALRESVGALEYIEVDELRGLPRFDRVATEKVLFSRASYDMTVGARVDAILVGDHTVHAVEIKPKSIVVPAAYLVQLFFGCLAISDSFPEHSVEGVIYYYAGYYLNDDIQLTTNIRDLWEWGGYVAYLAWKIMNIQTAIDDSKQLKKVTRRQQTMAIHKEYDQFELETFSQEAIELRFKLDDAAKTLVNGLIERLSTPVYVHNGV